MKFFLLATRVSNLLNLPLCKSIHHRKLQSNVSFAQKDKQGEHLFLHSSQPQHLSPHSSHPQNLSDSDLSERNDHRFNTHDELKVFLPQTIVNERARSCSPTESVCLCSFFCAFFHCSLFSFNRLLIACFYLMNFTKLEFHIFNRIYAKSAFFSCKLLNFFFLIFT